MEKKDLVQIISDIFIPLGFTKKGNNWVRRDKELTKCVNLQKSLYSDLYYINYGYIINGLELTTVYHVEDRLGSFDKEEQNKITDLLDLEKDYQEEVRVNELNYWLNRIIITEMMSINTTEDLANYLKQRSCLNDVPLVVKNYLNIE